eukprot:TRINITY_DN19373_c0_g1_i1.p1 TRINITY_DN19373_c0_g1~~TRINITY_DN19373_c0_g1_i1.p1  ORF type:complete len:142 (+),score=12.76 TRINITY_DN19373_c0_g1_i1:554-979(+)
MKLDGLLVERTAEGDQTVRVIEMKECQNIEDHFTASESASQQALLYGGVLRDVLAKKGWSVKEPLVLYSAGSDAEIPFKRMPITKSLQYDKIRETDHIQSVRAVARGQPARTARSSDAAGSRRTSGVIPAENFGLMGRVRS